ncbi:hypothetical protein V8E53_000723 [Lactarius tabidus]
MAPRTQRQHTTDTGPAATIPDSSTHTVRSKKKGKSTKTHCTLPNIVIKKLHTPVLADSEVSRKHPLSPEEGPTIRTERGAKSGFPKPTKRIKSGCFEETHPPGLKLPPTDNEAETTSQIASGFIVPGNVPPNRGRKLKQTETLIQEDNNNNSSLDNHCSHSSGSDGSDDLHPEVSKDNELDAIAEFIPTSKMAEKMALERPSWPTTTTEDGVQHQTAPSSVPLPSMLSSGEDIDVEFKHDQEANLEFTGAAFEGQQMTHVHAKHPQDDISDFSDTISEGLQVAHIFPKGYVKGQRAAHAAACSEHQPVSTLVSTVLTLYVEIQIQAILSEISKVHTMPLPRVIEAHTHLPAIRKVHASLPAISKVHVPLPAVSKVHVSLPMVNKAQIYLLRILKFLPQDSHVHRVLKPPPQDSKVFGFLHASIMLENSYPDALLTSKFIQDALSTAALHVPNAEDVHVRILKDHPYFVKMSILPRARISIFCSEVKEHCMAAIALLLGTHESATVISELVLKLQTDFNYIFLRCLNNANHQALFPSHEGTSGDVIWEVPKAMVALVSMAVELPWFYAALHEWELGKRKPHDFTANAFMEAYSTHISSLDSIETKHNTSYHSMMAEIYQLAVGLSTCNNNHLLIPEKLAAGVLSTFV